MTFLGEIIGTVVRTALVWFAAWLVAHGGPTLTSSQIANLTVAVSPAIAALIWSIASKYLGRQRLLTALATPVVQTEAQNAASAKISAPSVLTDQHTVPDLGVFK